MSVAFSDSTYKWDHIIHIYGLYLIDLTLHNALKSPPCGWKWQDFLLSRGWIIFHYILCIYHISLFIHRGTLRLFPCRGYREQYWNEHAGAGVSWRPWFHFLWVNELGKFHPGVELLDLVVVLFLSFLGISILFSVEAAPIYIPTNSALGSLSPCPWQHLLFLGSEDIENLSSRVLSCTLRVLLKKILVISSDYHPAIILFSSTHLLTSTS